MAMQPRRFRPLALLAGVAMAALVKACGSGGGGINLTTIIPPGTDSGGEAAISGRVLDPYRLLDCFNTNSPAFCQVFSGVVFDVGRSVELLNLNAQGDPLLPVLDVVPLETEGRFRILFQGQITDPVGQLVRVSGNDSSLRGFVFSAAVEVSPWSEAIYRILLQERDRGSIQWLNITAAELRDLENILFTQVPLSRSARSVEELVQALIQEAERLRFGNLRFIEDLIRVCYAPEGNQSDQPCRIQIPVPLPPPIATPTPTPRPTPTIPVPELPDPGPSLPPLTLTNQAFVTVNGVPQSSNTVSITVSIL